MSWPHVLSLSRVVAGPFVSALILATPGDAYLVAAGLFVLASLTDLLDGKLARYSQQVSPLGIFLDTTSDKVLVSMVLVSMTLAGLCAAWIPLLIISREFLISGLRSYAASFNQIISAHIWGKGKAAVTMIAIPCVLVAADGKSGALLSHLGTYNLWTNVLVATEWLLAASAALTLISGMRYIIDARSLFHQNTSSPPVEEQRPRIIAGDG